MSKPPYPSFGTHSGPDSRRVSGSVKLCRSDCPATMRQILVDHIRTCIAPDEPGLLGSIHASIRTPCGVSFWNCRSTYGQARVASRPMG